MEPRLLRTVLRGGMDEGAAVVVVVVVVVTVVLVVVGASAGSVAWANVVSGTG